MINATQVFLSSVSSSNECPSSKGWRAHLLALNAAFKNDFVDLTDGDFHISSFTVLNPVTCLPLLMHCVMTAR